MKSIMHLSAILLLAGLFTSCRGISDKNPAVQEKDTVTFENGAESLFNDPFILKYIADTSVFDYSDCIRAVATPILKKSLFPNAEFKLLSNNVTGLEVTKINDKDLLVIQNHGCEYFVLSFSFILNDNSIDTTDVLAQYELSIELMKKIVTGVDTFADLNAGIRKLQEYISAATDQNPVILNEELDYGGEFIRDYIVVEEFRRIENKSLLTVSMVTGPL